MVTTDEPIILDTGVATTVSRSTATTQLTKTQVLEKISKNLLIQLEAS
jgi:hypothetical protein